MREIRKMGQICVGQNRNKKELLSAGGWMEG